MRTAIPVALAFAAGLAVALVMALTSIAHP